MVSLPFYGALSASVIKFKYKSVNYRSAFNGDYKPVLTVMQCPVLTHPEIKCANANEHATGQIS